LASHRGDWGRVCDGRATLEGTVQAQAQEQAPGVPQSDPSQGTRWSRRASSVVFLLVPAAAVEKGRELIEAKWGALDSLEYRRRSEPGLA
jgi:hypothetical protein